MKKALNYLRVQLDSFEVILFSVGAVLFLTQVVHYYINLFR